MKRREFCKKCSTVIRYSLGLGWYCTKCKCLKGVDEVITRPRLKDKS
jgi:hypothetical protein